MTTSTALAWSLLFADSGPGPLSRCGGSTLAVCPSLKIFERLIDIRNLFILPSLRRPLHPGRASRTGQTPACQCSCLRFVGNCLAYVILLTALSNFGEVTPRFGSFQFVLTPGFWDVLALPYDAGVGALHRTDREPTSAAPRSILHDAPGLSGVVLVAFWSQI